VVCLCAAVRWCVSALQCGGVSLRCSAVVCLCAAVRWCRNNEMRTERRDEQLAIGQSHGLNRRTGTITNTLCIARRTQHPDNRDAAAAATTLTADCESNTEGYLVVQDTMIVVGAGNEVGENAVELAAAPEEVRMVTLQSHADKSMSFLIPMEETPSLIIEQHCEPVHNDDGVRRSISTRRLCSRMLCRSARLHEYFGRSLHICNPTASFYRTSLILMPAPPQLHHNAKGFRSGTDRFHHMCT
jgi:hypothetical protein